MKQKRLMTVFSRYILTHEYASHYDVRADDDGLSHAEVTLAELRRDMWPTSGTGLMAERIDNITRGLVDGGINPYAPVQRDAYPEGL